MRALEGGSSTTKQILIDQDLRGWKEVEYEVCVGVLWPSYAIDATRLRQTLARHRTICVHTPFMKSCECDTKNKIFDHPAR